MKKPTQQRKKPQLSQFTNDRDHLPITCDDQIIHCKKVAKNEWNDTWKTTKITQLHKSVQDFHQQTPKFNDRKEGIIITCLRTGYTKLTHEHKIKNSTPPTCTHCNNPHTARMPHRSNPKTEIVCGINANINLTSQNDIQRVLKNISKT